MYISDLYSNNTTKKYFIRTVGITNVQLKNYNPIKQRNLNVKLTLNKRPSKNQRKKLVGRNGQQGYRLDIFILPPTVSHCSWEKMGDLWGCGGGGGRQE
jgi:hypothetical protein